MIAVKGSRRSGRAVQLVLALSAAIALVTSCAGTEVDGRAVPAASKGVPSSSDATNGIPRSDLYSVPPEETLAKLRKADPCPLNDLDFWKKLAPKVDITGRGMHDCSLEVSGLSDGGRIIISLDTAAAFRPFGKDGVVKEQSHGHDVWRRPDSDPTQQRDCSYVIHYPGTMFATEVIAGKRPARDAPRGGPAVVWPERCDVVKDYVGTIWDKVSAMKPRAPFAPTQGNMLVGKDPCAKDADMKNLLGPGFVADRIVRGGPYDCTVSFRQPDGGPITYDVRIVYSNDVPDAPWLKGGEPYSFAGYQGLRTVTHVDQTVIGSDAETCSSRLDHGPGSEPEHPDEQFVEVTVDASNTMLGSGVVVQFPADTCAVMEHALTSTLDGAR